MKKSLTKFAVMTAFVAGSFISAQAFTDIKLDLTDGNFLSDEELTGNVDIKIGFVFDEEGEPVRTTATDPDAAIVLGGRFHSNEHGWGWFTSQFAVDGPVKISMGSCAWGGDVKVTDVATGEVVGTFNTNIGACYHQDKENNIVSFVYKGGPATLTANGGSYTPYFAVEAVDPSTLVDDVFVTFSTGDESVIGDLPKEEKMEPGTAYTIPANHTLYAEGKTLVAWTDGTNEYKIGDEVVITANTDLVAVFKTNKESIDKRNADVTVCWDFQKRNGAPGLAYEGVKGVYVAQAEVNGEVIDVKMDFDTTSGKLNNGSWNDWAQVNSGTVFTIPSCAGAVVSLEAYGEITTTTIDGKKDYEVAKVISSTITSEAETIEIVIGDGSYYRYVQTVLPANVVKVPFRDIVLDLTDGNFLSDAELAGANINIGFIIDEEGEPTRTTADDPNANIVLTGKYHSDEHGWGWFTSQFAVEGPVKISMGSCAWGGDVKITNVETGEVVGTFNTNIGACYHQDKENNIVSFIYKGEAAVLSANGGSYTPYFAVEAVDPSTIVEDVTLTFACDDSSVVGDLPKEEKMEPGTAYTIPANHTLYAEGKTLVAWTDGTAEYKPGEEYTVTGDATLTPVFAANTETIAKRYSDVTVCWDFQKRNGAPGLAYEGVKGVYVAQADVNGEVIDVKMDFDTTNGKLNNGSWNDWAQVNSGTVFTIPSCQGAVVSLEAYGDITTTTIDGAKDYESGKVITATVNNTAETIDVVIGDGSYYRYVQVVLPKNESSSLNSVLNSSNEGKTYNVYGIEVDDNYRGIVIRNGQKIYRK